MLIHSTNMETKVFINECQNLTEASEGMKESSLFQRSCRCLLLMLVTLLGLLVVGMVAHFIVWKAPNVVKSDFNCQGKFGLNWNFNLSGELEPHIFTAVNNGTYFIYGTLQKSEMAEVGCKDNINLVQRETDEIFVNKNFTNYMVKFKAQNVQLHEQSKVHLRINCKYKQIKADFRILYKPKC